jgi:DNA-binding HxlR family transcriptional regulator
MSLLRTKTPKSKARNSEENDIANRKVIEDRPLRVEYTLTNKGPEVATLLKHINEII